MGQQAAPGPWDPGATEAPGPEDPGAEGPEETERQESPRSLREPENTNQQYHNLH